MILKARNYLHRGAEGGSFQVSLIVSIPNLVLISRYVVTLRAHSHCIRRFFELIFTHPERLIPE